MRQQALDRQNKLLDLQLRNSDVDRAYKEALIRKADAFTKGSDALSGMGSLDGFYDTGTDPATGAPRVTPSTTDATVAPAPVSSVVDPTGLENSLAGLAPEVRQTILDEVKKTGLSPTLAAVIPKLVKQESAGQQTNPDGSVVTSPKGAQGLFQLMPATASSLGVDPTDPVQNAQGGVRYLAQMEKEFGDPRLALAAYNAGPGAVRKYGGIPPYPETQKYVSTIGAGLPEGSFELAAGAGGTATDAPNGYGRGQQSGAAGLPAYRPPQVDPQGAAYNSALQGLEMGRRRALDALGKVQAPEAMKRQRAAEIQQDYLRRRQSVLDSHKLYMENAGKAREQYNQDFDRSFRINEAEYTRTKDAAAQQRQQRQDTRQQGRDADEAEKARLEDIAKLSKDFTSEPVEDPYDPERPAKIQRNAVRAAAMQRVLQGLDDKWRFQPSQRREVAGQLAEWMQAETDPRVLYEKMDAEINRRQPAYIEQQAGIAAAKAAATQGRADRAAAQDARGWARPQDANSGRIQDEPASTAGPATAEPAPQEVPQAPQAAVGGLPAPPADSWDRLKQDARESDTAQAVKSDPFYQPEMPYRGETTPIAAGLKGFRDALENNARSNAEEMNRWREDERLKALVREAVRTYNSVPAGMKDRAATLFEKSIQGLAPDASLADYAKMYGFNLE